MRRSSSIAAGGSGTKLPKRAVMTVSVGGRWPRLRRVLQNPGRENAKSRRVANPGGLYFNLRVPGSVGVAALAAGHSGGRAALAAGFGAGIGQAQAEHLLVVEF